MIYVTFKGTWLEVEKQIIEYFHYYNPQGYGTQIIKDISTSLGTRTVTICRFPTCG